MSFSNFYFVDCYIVRMYFIINLMLVWNLNIFYLRRMSTNWASQFPETCLRMLSESKHLQNILTETGDAY